MIGRNILANAIGGSWSTILYVLIVPIQIRTFGGDAYGLLAFVSTFHIIVGVFDLGLSPTITRELAIDTSPGHRHSRDLVRTLSAGYGAIGVVLGGSLILGADWLVNHWLNLGAFPADSARTVLQLSGLTLMLRWPVSFFSAVIVGRGRFDILNLLKSIAVTYGLLGGALIIVAFRDLVLFAAWITLAALTDVAMYLFACFRVLPGLSLWPRVSRGAIAQVWRFALGMGLVGALSTAIAYSDRLLLSALVPIETLGYYALAHNVMFGLTLAQGFVTSALYPSFAAKHHRGAMDELVSNYNWATQGLVYVCALPIAALTFFGEDILRVWTTAEVAAPAARILSVLAPGFLLNASLAIASTLAVATGHPGIAVRVNLVGLGCYLPLLYLAAQRWGGVGAAAAWLVLNIAYIFWFLPFVQRNIVHQTTRDWIRDNLLPFLVLGTLSFGGARGLLSITGRDGGIATLAVGAAAALTYGLWGLRWLDPALRHELRQRVKRLMMAATRTRPSRAEPASVE